MQQHQDKRTEDDSGMTGARPACPTAAAATPPPRAEWMERELLC